MIVKSNIETEICNLQKCESELLTEWGQWSSCSATCGSGGSKIRKRNCFDEKCEDELVQEG
jgi:hypothetical protein